MEEARLGELAGMLLTAPLRMKDDAYRSRTEECEISAGEITKLVEISSGKLVSCATPEKIGLLLVNSA